MHFNKKMWREALFCSVYVLNRLPTNSLKCTPYEMWEKRNIKTMQIFGSIAFVKRLDPLKKLEERSKRLYLEYAPNGCRLWNPKKKKIIYIIARDVRFQETSLKKIKVQI